MTPILTIKQAAAYLQIAPSTLYRIVQERRLPATKVGGGWRVRKDLLDEWLKDQAMGGALRILVVDDEPPVCEIFQEVLGPAGHRVTVAKSGQEALRWAETVRFDLIFLDLHFPGQNGVEVFKALRQLQHLTPVVIITGYTESPLLAEAIELGPLTVMKKPFAMEQILQAIRLSVRSGPRVGPGLMTQPGGAARHL